MQPTKLTLADGKVFAGFAPKGQKNSPPAEVVFNTGMTGYEESLTDPSYAGQILVFTYPLMGNYGVSGKNNWESDKIHAYGVVVSESCQTWSHQGSHQSLLDWLKNQNVPIITGVDTRALTKHLRVQGTMGGIIGGSKSSLKNFIFKTKIVSVARPIIYNENHKKTIILVDCGAKNNILRLLIKLPVKVKKVPYDYDYTHEDYDGVVISNGPGDPADYKKTVSIVCKAFVKNKPIFGICLGSQLMGLAAGAETYKLRFGHRGHNQPCISASPGQCYITSQNHGYAIDEKTLPKDWEVNFRNLNDDSIEGIRHKIRPFFSVQFHPEASPGPTDTSWLFKKFWETL
ncbi:glutamine-hydrolyzing carbamoyl-phosphate synthase small subunit [Candidatus Saccharibacteria bacterium]|nr:glutamine-hydrolyzing carbamoyl-phosphate synthase small subunit [Candidatus Saccharibacteria bacterium]